MIQSFRLAPFGNRYIFPSCYVSFHRSILESINMFIYIEYTSVPDWHLAGSEAFGDPNRNFANIATQRDIRQTLASYRKSFEGAFQSWGLRRSPLRLYGASGTDAGNIVRAFAIYLLLFFIRTAILLLPILRQYVIVRTECQIWGERSILTTNKQRMQKCLFMGNDGSKCTKCKNAVIAEMHWLEYALYIHILEHLYFSPI